MCPINKYVTITLYIIHRSFCFAVMRLYARTIALGATLAGLAVPGVLGWGAAGHEIIATIAQIYTEPDVLDKLCRIMNASPGIDFAAGDTGDHDNGRDAGLFGLWADRKVRQPTDGDWPCHLASVATWADKYKYRMRWSAPLHYIGAVGDHPPDECLFPGPEGWMGRPNINILGGIYNTSNILLDYVDGEISNVELAQEALKFIVHFIGDLHMPLHLVGRDRGGNSVDVCWEGRRMNLHSVWDGHMIAKAIRQTPYNYTRHLPGGFEQVEKSLNGTIYDSFVRKIIWEGVEQKWVEDLDEWIACPAVAEESLGSTLHRFFLPNWITKRTVDVPMTDTEFICPYHWAKPIHALNCELIWPKELSGSDLQPRRARCARFPHTLLQDNDSPYELDDPPYELDNPGYTKPIEERMLLEQFLAQGGVRLAAVLNHIFTDQTSL